MNKVGAEAFLSLERSYRHLVQNALATLRRIVSDPATSFELAAIAASDLETAMSLTAEQTKDRRGYEEAQRLLTHCLQRITGAKVDGLLAARRASMKLYFWHLEPGSGEAAREYYRDAVEEMEAAVTFEPDNVEYVCQLGMLLAECKLRLGVDRSDEAIQRCRAAARMRMSRRRRPEVLLSLAIVLWTVAVASADRRSELLPEARRVLAPVMRANSVLRVRAEALSADIDLLEWPASGSRSVGRTCAAVADRLAETTTYDLIGFLDRWLAAAEAPNRSDEDRADALYYRTTGTIARAADPVTLAERDRTLINHGKIPARAGFRLIRTGRVLDAVIALETSRAVLFGRLTGWLDQDFRDALADGQHSGLLARYEEALRRVGDRYREQYDKSAKPYPTIRVGAAAFGTGFTSELAAAQAKADAIAARIKELTGMAPRTQRPVDYTDVHRAAVHFPLVYLAVAEEGGYAVIVDGKREPVPIQLPTFDYKAAVTFAEAINEPDGSEATVWRAADSAVDWLAHTALSPLIRALMALRRPPDGPRIGLIPVGVVGSLPISAALLVGMTDQGGRPIAVHHLPYARVVTPSPHGRHGAVLVFASPVGHQGDPSKALVGIDRECAWLRTKYGSRVRIARAGVRDVLSGARGAEIVQFFCHGKAVDNDPQRSYLSLEDDRLTVRELLLPRACSPHRLVVLAACESQMFDRRMPDEVMGLPLAFLQAKTSAVLATRWRATERPMSILLRHIHDNLERGMDPATALAVAQNWLRRATGDQLLPYGYRLSGGFPPYTEPHEWGAFTCSGQ